MNPAISTEALDDIQAMRFGMEQGLRDLKWNERNAGIPGETIYGSPGDSVQFTMAKEGTYWAFGFDNSEECDEIYYATYAEGDTWIEFERALLLAQAIEEELPGRRSHLIGKWWDSFPNWESLRGEWFATRNLRMPPAVYSKDRWAALHSCECETIETEVLKGVTK